MISICCSHSVFFSQCLLLFVSSEVSVSVVIIFGERQTRPIQLNLAFNSHVSPSDETYSRIYSYVSPSADIFRVVNDKMLTHHFTT